MRSAMSLLVLALVLAGCDDATKPQPPPPWVHGRVYAVLRNDASRACFYREIEQSAADGSPVFHWALHNDDLWSQRYFTEQQSLEQRGYATPKEEDIFPYVCSL